MSLSRTYRIGSPVTDITSAVEFAELRSLPRAFIFIDVDWAIQARGSASVFDLFLSEWDLQHPDLPIPAYRADLSDQNGEVWEYLRKWLKEDGQPFDRLTYGGYGELLWILSGSIVALRMHLAVAEPADLVAATQRIYGLLSL